MKPQDYGKDCPNTGLVLLPPVFTAQIEIVMTSLVLEPAKRDVLRQLKDLVQENQRKSWFAIYLCMFILLHSCAMLTAADNKKANKQGLDVRFPAVSSITNTLTLSHCCRFGSSACLSSRNCTMEQRFSLPTSTIATKEVIRSRWTGRRQTRPHERNSMASRLIS
jgi:hypothetical protein